MPEAGKQTANERRWREAPDEVAHGMTGNLA